MESNAPEQVLRKRARGGGGDNATARQNGDHGAKRKKTGGGGKWHGSKGQRTDLTGGISTPGQRSGSTITSSGIANGDVGVFVTCDKGMEKRALRELEDILSDYLDLESGFEGKRDEQGVENSVTESTAPEVGDRDNEVDIEQDIQAELAEMRGQSNQRNGYDVNESDQSQTSRPTTAPPDKRLSLVTLDIPCVSFVRFPTNSSHHPVEVVHRICSDAAAAPTRPRSRYIKRLTPVNVIRKVMNDGIIILCDEILPAHFGEPEPETSDGKDRTPIKYAIRPTIRNNNQVNRDEVIKVIAEQVMTCGPHKVDLKGYDKLVLLEVYRGVCGMAVVGSDFEDLKRFNLAEIYAAGRLKHDDNNGHIGDVKDSVDSSRAGAEEQG